MSDSIQSENSHLPDHSVVRAGGARKIIIVTIIVIVAIAFLWFFVKPIVMNKFSPQNDSQLSETNPFKTETNPFSDSYKNPFNNQLLK